MKEYKDFGEVCLKCEGQLEFTEADYDGDGWSEIWHCTECNLKHSVPMIRDWTDVIIAGGE
jgi:hypothetical protein